MKLIHIIVIYYNTFGIENLVRTFMFPLLEQKKNSFTMQLIEINTGMTKTNF